MKPKENSDLKQNLKNSEATIGSWITLSHPGIAEIMAKAGFDWLVVDLEHSVITIREAEELIRVIDLCGVTPLVRVSSNDPIQIKRVMDAGAHGVIVPMINSANEAERVVSAIKYPPQGTRSVGLARAQGYGNNFEEYLKWAKKDSIVIVQIEHIDAVKNLESILSVKEVDGFIVGPYDLSGSLGIPGQFDHPLMIDTMQRILSLGKKLNKAPGVHITEPNIDELKQRKIEGYKFIGYSLDIRMLDQITRIGTMNFRNT